MYAAEPLAALPLDDPTRDVDGIWRQQRELGGWPEGEPVQDRGTRPLGLPWVHRFMW